MPLHSGPGRGRRASASETCGMPTETANARETSEDCAYSTDGVWLAYGDAAERSKSPAQPDSQPWPAC